MAEAKLNPAGLAQMRARIAEAIQEAALAAGLQLEENVSPGPRSGHKYPQLPRRSSAPSEFLQSQSGDLLASVDVRDGAHEFQKRPGFHDAPYGTDVLGALEFGNRAGTLAGRKSTTRTFESPETHQKMRDAAKAVKR
jgi:hypothetical protein